MCFAPCTVARAGDGCVRCVRFGGSAGAKSSSSSSGGDGGGDGGIAELVWETKVGSSALLSLALHPNYTWVVGWLRGWVVGWGAS